MHTNAPVAAPDPSGPAVQAMVVMVPTVEMPILPHNAPMSAVPALVNAQAVQMATDATVPSPEPSGSLVIVVATMQVPVGTDVTP